MLERLCFIFNHIIWIQVLLRYHYEFRQQSPNIFKQSCLKLKKSAPRRLVIYGKLLIISTDNWHYWMACMGLTTETPVYYMHTKQQIVLLILPCKVFEIYFAKSFIECPPCFDSAYLEIHHARRVNAAFCKSRNMALLRVSHDNVSDLISST